MRFNRTIPAAAVFLLMLPHSASAQSAAAPQAIQPVAVTEANFRQAETDMYFSQRVKATGLGKLYHFRSVVPIDHQTVIRVNRDTLYSTGVFDLQASPVTITLPDPGARFMSMIVIDEEQYALKTVYAPGTFTITRSDVPTRYVLLGFRTFVDPNDPKDIARANALQDAIKVEQSSTGTFDVPQWDPASRKTVHDELVKRAASLPDTKGMFGPRGKVDPDRHLIGTATGWGGNAPEDALYLTVVPPRNDGKTVHRLVIKDPVPIDGFWSISVYGADGYFHKNSQDAYSVNNVTAKKGADGSVTVQFGDCDGKVPNCLPVTEGWNYWVRLYRPHKQVLDGTYKFPEAKPVS
jgi:hypothetical protein